MQKFANAAQQVLEIEQQLNSVHDQKFFRKCLSCSFSLETAFFENHGHLSPTEEAQETKNQIETVLKTHGVNTGEFWARHIRKLKKEASSEGSCGHWSGSSILNTIADILTDNAEAEKIWEQRRYK